MLGLSLLVPLMSRLFLLLDSKINEYIKKSKRYQKEHWFLREILCNNDGINLWTSISIF